MSGQLRFALNERAPDSIKSQGGISGNAISVENESEVKALLKTIHDTKPEEHGRGNPDWALLTYAGKDLKTLKLMGSGNGGLSELREAGLQDDMVAYGLLRVVDVVDNIPTTRFAYITWMGDAVSGVNKARIGTNKTAVSAFIGHYNIEHLCSSKDELTDSAVVGRVQDASGSKVRVQETTQPSGGVTRGPHAGKAYSFVPTSTSGGDSGNFQNEAELRDLQKRVRADADSLDWMLLGYVTKTSVGLVGSGSGGVSEMRSHLKDDQVLYGFFRVEDQIDATKMYRFIYVRWVGDAVSAMVKGRLTTHRGMMQDFFAPYHIELEVTDQNGISDDVIKAKVQAMKGSKK